MSLESKSLGFRVGIENDSKNMVGGELKVQTLNSFDPWAFNKVVKGESTVQKVRFSLNLARFTKN